MINLIKNELIKIFRKKAIYITLIITLVFIIACNFIFKMQQDNYGYNVASEIEFYEERLKEVNPKEDIDIYLIYKTELDVANLIQSYGGTNTWQAPIIEKYLRSVIDEMNDYQYNENNQTKYEETKAQYDQLKAKLDADDWHYFVEKEKKEVENELAEQNELKKNTQNQIELKNIENQIASLEVEKQIINWRLEKEISYGYNYQNTCLSKYRSAKESIRDYEENQNQEDEYEAKQQYYFNLETAAIAQYDIEHGTEAGNNTNARGILLSIFDQFELFIVIMVVMIAGTIVSEEFSKGTIKLLLIKPYKRTTILAAKFISCIIVLLIIIVLMMAMQFIVGGVVQGFDSLSLPAVVYNHNTNQIQEINTISYLCMQTLGKLPIYILLMTLAFGISTILTNSAIAITIGLLGYMGSPFINELGLAFKLWWLKFFVTPNWDLTQYFFGGLPKFEGLTSIFSIAIIIAYMLIMLVPTFIILKKKNIKNI